MTNCVSPCMKDSIPGTVGAPSGLGAIFGGGGSVAVDTFFDLGVLPLVLLGGGYLLLRAVR